VVMIGAGWLLLGAPDAVGAAPAGQSPSQPLPPDMLARAAAVTKFPTFNEIPPAPTAVPTPQAYRALVVDTRLEGAQIVARTAPETFVLSDTDGFASAARTEATPPPPMALSGAVSTADFAASARGRALPPAPR